MGGGQDRDQIAVRADMAATKRDALHAAADRGAVVLAVCGGYQLLGHSYELGERGAPRRGLVDYLRSGRPVDTHARAIVTRQGRRVTNVRVEAWQEDRDDAGRDRARDLPRQAGAG